MISCVLLCGGHSSRFGSPKALAVISGKPVIQRLQETLLGSNLDEIIVVLGAKAVDIEPYLLKHKKIKVVHNKDYNLGQTSSFKAGLKEVSLSSQGIMLLPVDFPLLEPGTVNFLIETFEHQAPHILIPTYQGKKGHPPIFNGLLKKELLALNDNEGINTIAHKHADGLRLCPVMDQGILLSFNTREEFEEIIRRKS